MFNRLTRLSLTTALALTVRDVPAVSLPEGSPEEPFIQKVRTLHSREEFQVLTRGEIEIDRDASPAEQSLIQSFCRQLPVPWESVTVVAQSATADLWIGTESGLVVQRLPSGRVEYLAGRRWLPDDKVSGIGLDSHGVTVWVETPAGFSRIEHRPMTLGEKARLFQDRVRARHVRHGYTASSRLLEPGDLSSNQPLSTDNDGLWTAMYLAAESFRFRVSGDAEARSSARQALRALMRLEEITGIPGFPARSIIQVGTDVQPEDGEWHDSGDGEWRWKGDTSSDEIVGHYFGYAVYFDLVADEQERREISEVVLRITDHILDHHYHLVDVDGRPTRWGWWAPEEIWADPDETGLRALHLLSHLKVAEHVTQGQARKRYGESYRDLIENHRYHLLTRNQKINYPGLVNHSDDELAFLSYYPLLLYEQDPVLRRVYLQSLERCWRVERPERNPLWNFIYAAAGGFKEFDLQESLRTLQEIPLDLVSWTVSNSHRLDVPFSPYRDRFGRTQSLIVLPYDQLPIMKWNGNPYQVDGGDGGRREDDGTFFLLPYWMGRYHSVIP